MNDHDIRQQIKGIYRGDQPLSEAHLLNHALERIEQAMEPDDDEGLTHPVDNLLTHAMEMIEQAMGLTTTRGSTADVPEEYGD